MSELVSLPRSSSEEVHAVWESTGSFHCLVATALLENGIFVSIVNSLRMEWELPLPARQYYQKASILINSKVDSFCGTIGGSVFCAAGQTQSLATPLLRAASATAFATAGPTRGSNAAGMI